jgi:cobalt/nickel transport protein
LTRFTNLTDPKEPPMSNLCPKPARRARQAVLSALLLAALLAAPLAATAHFQELIPSTEIVDADTSGDLTLALTFTHPMEQGPAMAMGEPVAFGVLTADGRQDLKDLLTPVQVDGNAAYQASYKVPGPGGYMFYVEPAPYWEPAEGVMIVHYTKTVVDAYGAGEGWDRMVGLPVEIEPLTRPYGLWTGNVFTGVVRKAGGPVPFAEVEVEWRNDGSVQPPAALFVTQVLKADGNGVFSYAMPRAGWWGFAALIEGDAPMQNPDGEEVPVEEGALIWVRARDMAP